MVFTLRFCKSCKIAISLLLIAGTTFGFVHTKQSQNNQIASRQRQQQRPQQHVTVTMKQGKDEDSIIPVGSNTAASPALTPVESWFVTHMDLWYSRSLSIKCPFFRRRMADLLDATDMLIRFLVIRHKSLDLIGPPPGCRSTTMSGQKHPHLSMQDLCDTIRRDWRENTNKGYYITGRLNTTIYRDDCLFDGPDPDMPVRGLRKYLNAASHLFDHSKSSAELLSLEIVEGNNDETRKILARWKIQGVLHLPWRPQLPIWTGSTTYHFDKNRLICLHEESWDITVLEAFTETLFPEVANRIWNRYPE